MPDRRLRARSLRRVGRSSCATAWQATGARAERRGARPGAHRRSGRRHRDRTGHLRAQRDVTTGAGVDREAPCRVRGTQGARPGLSDKNDRPRTRYAEGSPLEGASRSEGLWRSKPARRGAARAGHAAQSAGHQARNRLDHRRRVVLRRQPHSARLETVLLQGMVAPALSPDRRPSLFQGKHRR